MTDTNAKAASRRRRQARSTQSRKTAPPPRRRRSYRSETVGIAGSKARDRGASLRPRATLRRLIALGAVAGLAALLVWLFVDDAFYVTTADIAGVRYSSASDVYNQAGIDGYSIFWIDGGETADRLEALPYVKAAGVHASLPNRVRIEIEERVPVAVWKADGRDYWVDSDGITMPVASLVDALPVFWDLDGSTVTEGGRVDPELIAAVRSLRDRQPDVSEYGYDRINGLQFRMPAGTLVYLGKPDGLAKRVRQLAVLQQNLASEGRTPAEINWRVEDGFYLR
jgi:cell division protein FtsQ